MPVDESQSGMDWYYNVMPLEMPVGNEPIVTCNSSSCTGVYLGSSDLAQALDTDTWNYMASLVPYGESWIIIGSEDASGFVIYGDNVNYSQSTGVISGRGTVVEVYYAFATWGTSSVGDQLSYWYKKHGDNVSLNIRPAQTTAGVKALPAGSFDGLIDLDTSPSMTNFLLPFVLIVVLAMYISGKLFDWVMRREKRE